ncbi:hypothetical protein [Hydrotalea sp.]|uniref:hypothetical protein n=1 Tax=Hydrotalea sp. TaxID=2881279 RepID=UPI003D116991
MKFKKILFFFHFSLVTVIAIGAMSQIFQNKLYNSISNILYKVTNLEPLRTYSFFSGINTGYGFYGYQVATPKYFSVVIRLPNDSLIELSNMHFSFRANQERVNGLAQAISNKIADRKEEKDSSVFTQMFINKYMKYTGKYLIKINNIKDSGIIFKTRINQLITHEIWNKKERNATGFIETEYYFE